MPEVRVRDEVAAQRLLEHGGSLIRLAHDMVAPATTRPAVEGIGAYRLVAPDRVDVDQISEAAALATPPGHVDAPVWMRLDRPAHWQRILDPGSSGEPLLDGASNVVLDERSIVVGAAVVTCKAAAEWWPGGAWLQEIFVVPEHQGRHLGGALLARTFNVVHDAGLERIGLTVSEGNPAARLYERFGFTRFRSTWIIDAV